MKSTAAHALQKVGLPAKQAAIYIALLEIGEGTATQVARKAAIKRTTVFLALQDMASWGYVSEIKKEKKRLYSAAHPRKLLELSRARLEQIEDVYPELLALHRERVDKPRIQVFEGVAGVQRVYQDIYTSLERQQELVGFTRVDAFEDNELILADYKKLLRRLKNPHLRELNYDNRRGRQWEEETRSLRGSHHQIRFIPDNMRVGLADCLLYNDTLALFSLSDAGTPMATVIADTHLYTTMKAMFDMAWLQGDEVATT